MIWASKIILYMTPQMAPTTDPTQNRSEAPQNLSEAQQTPQNLNYAIRYQVVPNKLVKYGWYNIGGQFVKQR